MTGSDPKQEEINEADIAIEMFSVLVEQEQALIDSRQVHRSEGEKQALYRKSEELRKKFNQLADEAEGKIQPRARAKGEAYCLANYYLERYPNGSVTVSKQQTPSLIQFARSYEDQTIETISGLLEVGECNNERFELALEGKALEIFSIGAIGKGFQRAKKAIKEK